MAKPGWPHQVRGIDQLRAGFLRGHRRGCLVVPTGGGKTVLAWMMAEKAVARGGRCLFVADRRVLVTQAARSAREYGLDVGVVMRDAPWGYRDRDAPVQVVSKDSLVSWLARPDFDLPPASCVFTDECHKSFSETWDVLLNRYPDAWEVGLTATPARGDGRGLGERYQFLCQPTTYAELQSLGVLVKATCYAPGARVEGKAGRRPTRASLVGDAVYWWRKWADGMRTFVFCSGVSASLALRDSFRGAGVAAEHIDADTPDDERDRILAALADGTVQVVCNCAVLRYGVDVPAVECAVIHAPMGSVVDYRQSVGRVLRAAPGKTSAVVIDHAGAVLYHGFPDADLPWTLDGETDHAKLERKRMKSGEAARPIACPECHTLFSGRRNCPACGWEPKRRSRATATRAGTLQLVDREGGADPDPADLRRLWQRALWIAAGKGLTLGAAASIFRRDAGRWPDEAGVEPRYGRHQTGVRAREFLDSLKVGAA